MFHIARRCGGRTALLVKAFEHSPEQALVKQRYGCQGTFPCAVVAAAAGRQRLEAGAIPVPGRLKLGGTEDLAITKTPGVLAASKMLWPSPTSFRASEAIQRLRGVARGTEAAKGSGPSFFSALCGELGGGFTGLQEAGDAAQGPPDGGEDHYEQEQQPQQDARYGGLAAASDIDLATKGAGQGGADGGAGKERATWAGEGGDARGAHAGAAGGGYAGGERGQGRHQTQKCRRKGCARTRR